MIVSDFQKYKNERKKISMVTVYDYTFARIIDATHIDAVLVGDSLSMVMNGHSSTLQANTPMMAYHTESVSRGISNKFIIADMPFLSFRKGLKTAMESVETLIKAGAHAVKLEGVEGHEDVIKHIIQSDIPVMGHLGLTPQSIHKLGGYKVQGREKETAEILFSQAKKLENLGCFSIVLECVPSSLAKELTGNLHIPTIGIGAGPHTDGQILVLQDLLGMVKDFSPKFVKHYMAGFDEIKSALNQYNNEIKEMLFPGDKESYQ